MAINRKVLEQAFLQGLGQEPTPISDDERRKQEALNEIANYTGMKTSAIDELGETAAQYGYDSSEYNQLNDVLAEGDPDQAQRITNSLQAIYKNRLGENMQDRVDHAKYVNENVTNADGTPVGVGNNGEKMLDGKLNRYSEPTTDSQRLEDYKNALNLLKSRR